MFDGSVSASSADKDFILYVKHFSDEKKKSLWPITFQNKVCQKQKVNSKLSGKLCQEKKWEVASHTQYFNFPFKYG